MEWTISLLTDLNWCRKLKWQPTELFNALKDSSAFKYRSIHIPNASQPGNYCQAWQKAKGETVTAAHAFICQKKKNQLRTQRFKKKIKEQHPSDLHLLHDVRLRLKHQPGAVLSSAGDMEIKWPASQPRRPVAASATPSRLLKGDTIPINVFLSTLLRCLFNTAPGGFRARTAWVKLHFSGLKERCDKRLMQVRDSQGLSGSKQLWRTDKGC